MEKGSSSSSASGGGGDAADSVFNGLNFGKKIYFEGVDSGLRQRLPEEEKAAEHPRSPAKKGRTAAAVQGGQPPRCQVEGCDVDLSGTKAYYCRHKVCGTHSKSSQVIVAGLHQRFCQQCSRFHQLAEFDQGKRSCRRRLAGHNERRRKPPPLSSSSSYTTSQLSPHTFDNRSKSGAIVMDFSGRRNSWPNNNTITTTKHEQEEDDDDDDLLEGSTTMHSYRGPVISSEGSSSTSALSLLSNQPTLDPVSQFSWGFKHNNHHHHHRDQQQDNNISSTSLHEMAPRMPSLGEQFTQYSRDDEPSRRFHQPSEGRYNGLDGSRSAYDSSDQHINWSL